MAYAQSCSRCHRNDLSGGETAPPLKGPAFFHRWQDLALFLIARFVGLKEAIEVARVYMLQWHDMGQQPFASLMSFRQTGDAVI